MVTSCPGMGLEVEGVISSPPIVVGIVWALAKTPKLRIVKANANEIKLRNDIPDILS